MRIGLLVTSVGNFGEKGFYNAQEIGLAKALDQLFDEVKIYKLIYKDGQGQEERIKGTKNTSLTIIPTKTFGNHGIINTNLLDKTLDILIYFCDMQIAVPRVYHWTQNNNIKFYPYIGVIESHSTNIIKCKIVNTLFKRNIAVYKKCNCLVKTPEVKNKLESCGVSQITVTPVGLDLSLLHKDYTEIPIDKLKLKYGYNKNDKVVLFIGRFVEEKQPLRMIDIFNELSKKDDSYQLLMVGMGELKAETISKSKSYGISGKIKFLDKIPNINVWELYRIAEVFVNLNSHEIFGMAILEAMFYECKVVAWKAPGPNLIIESGVSGYLVDSNDKVIDKVMKVDQIQNSAHNRVINTFTWENMAKEVYNLVLK